jgi:hypothetical protein
MGRCTPIFGAVAHGPKIRQGKWYENVVFVQGSAATEKIPERLIKRRIVIEITQLCLKSGQWAIHSCELAQMCEIPNRQSR